MDAADVDASIARIARLATKKKAIANAASEKALEKAKAVADETLTPSSVAWAKKHLTDFQTGECWVHSNANDADAADSIARTVAGRVRGAAAVGGGASMRRRRRDDGAVRARRGEALDASRGRVFYAMARVFSRDSPTRRPRWTRVTRPRRLLTRRLPSPLILTRSAKARSCCGCCALGSTPRWANPRNTP